MNIIIILVILLIVVLAGRSAIGHFHGQGGCCCGGDYKPRRKHLKNIRCKKIFTVEGMHCEHCKNRVEEVVNDISGVAGHVDLRRGELTVSYAEDVADDVIRQKIERAGYTVTACRSEK